MHPLLVKLIEQIADDYANCEEAGHCTHRQLIDSAESVLRQNGTLEKIQSRLDIADSYIRDRNETTDWRPNKEIY